MREHKTERGRGLGPFTGRQLTTIVCVAIVAMVMIPTAAIAAGVSFTSNSNGSPAVNGKNTASNGVGVSGKGKRYGVFSNGPLGVVNGKKLSCGGCVGTGALATAAKVIQPLASGQSESGTFGTADSYPTTAAQSLIFGVTFVRPVPGTLHYEVGPSVHCTSAGSANPGYFCIYASTGDVTFAGAILSSAPVVGAILFWTELGGGKAFAYGTYTVKAP
jgi:hypothetical protein